jgi:predicted DNA-binding transcriptional regulator YafY
LLYSKGTGSAMPTKRSSGGDKRSSWLTFHRRLFLVRQLIRGPATTAELIATARQAFGEEIYPPDEGTALRRDLAKLREEFECDIKRDSTGRYTLVSPGRLALLDLPEAEVEALAFLAATFADGDLPNAQTVDSLLTRVAELLPTPRREQLRTARAQPRIDRPQPSSVRSDRTVALLKRLVGREQVTFDYRSPYTSDDAAVSHCVHPYELFYRDGHLYLEAFCVECGIPELSERYVLYRVDRMVAGTVKRGHVQLPPTRKPRRTYLLRYRLDPQVARQRDIALWFPDSRVEFLLDGAAFVTAMTSDLWQARQILLRYREHCRVLEPPELVAMLRESIERMARVYAEDSSAEAPVRGDT